MASLKAAITGVGGYVPDTKLTNADLEKMVDTSDEWITTRTGIKERRILREPGKASAYMGEQAALDLLAKRGIDADEIDVVICATVTPDTIFPDTANTIATAIGADRAFGFDLAAACSGFLFALNTGARMIESGAYQKVLVIGVDMMSSIVDYTDRTTCILFGDGAGCVLLEPSLNEEGFVDAVLRGDGKGAKYLRMKAGGSMHPPSHETIDNKEHYLFQEGRPVFKAAVKGMRDATLEVLERNQTKPEEVGS